MSIELPYIKNQTTDNSAMTYIPPDSIKIAMPIEGTTGRMSTMKISSQAQLLNEYSVTSEISPKLSDSILHALKILQFSPIYASRVGSTNVLPGRSDKPGVDGNYTVFTDSEYSPYYKSFRYTFGSRDKLTSVEITGESDTTSSESKKFDNIYDALIDYGAKSINDNGTLIDFLTTNKITSFKVNDTEIIDNSDFTVVDLSKKTIKLSYDNTIVTDFSNTLYDSSDADPISDGFYLQLNGNSFINASDPNIEDTYGTGIPLQFYNTHGSRVTAASMNRLSSDLPIEAVLIYVMDYLKANSLITPVVSDYDNFKIMNIPEGTEIEVIGDQLKDIVTFENGTLSVKPNTYAPDNCGFKIIYDNEKYFIGLGNFSSEATNSNYYRLSTSDFSTVEKLVYRVYEVLKYAGDKSWLYIPGADGIIMNPQSIPKFYFLNTNLIQYKVEPKVGFLKFYEDGNELYSYTVGDTKYQIENLKYSNQYITITKSQGTDVVTSKDYIFYTGTYPYGQSPNTEYIRLSSADKIAYGEFLSLLISALKTKFNATYAEVIPTESSSKSPVNGFKLYEKDISVNYKLMLDKGNCEILNIDLDKSPDEGGIYDKDTGLVSDVVDYTSVINNASVIVVSTGLNSENILKFQITKDTNDSELYHLLLTRKNNEESYVISFVEDKVDGYGVTRYYTYVNDDDTGSKYFRLVRVNKNLSNLPKDYVESPLFGSEVPQGESSATDWQVAVNRFREPTGDQYDFIFDSGHVNASLAKTIASVGFDLYSGVGLTLLDTKSVDELVTYRRSLDIDNRQVVMRAPRVPDTTLGNFVVYMSPITQYLQRLIMNKSAGKEFAPIFGITNGSASLPPKYKYDSEEERQKLVDAQIAPLIWDRAEQLSYFLLDLTGQSLDSNMSDFNNVRMDNLIAHISDKIAIKYIGRFNDKETREEFVGELEIAIQQRLISHQLYRINAYKIICDETNNPNSVVDARQLVVDIYEQYRPGIRYVKIYQGIYKLSQSI